MRIFIVILILFCSVHAQVRLLLHSEAFPNKFISNRDTISSLNDENNIKSKHHSIFNVAFQVFSSPEAGGISATIPLICANLSKESGKNFASNMLVGVSVASYLLGSAIGVKWVANLENNRVEYWKIVEYGAIGGFGLGSTTFAIARLIKQSAFTPTYFAFIGGVIIGSVIYTTSIAPWPVEAAYQPPSKKISSQKDIIESAKLIDLQVLEISF